MPCEVSHDCLQPVWPLRMRDSLALLVQQHLIIPHNHWLSTLPGCITVQWSWPGTLEQGAVELTAGGHDRCTERLHTGGQCSWHSTAVGQDDHYGPTSPPLRQPLLRCSAAAPVSRNHPQSRSALAWAPAAERAVADACLCHQFLLMLMTVGCFLPDCCSSCSVCITSASSAEEGCGSSLLCSMRDALEC